MEYKRGYQAITLLDNGDFFGDFCLLDKLSHFTFKCQEDTMVIFIAKDDLIGLITEEFPEELKSICLNARLRLQYFFYQKAKLGRVSNDLSLAEFDMETYFDRPKQSETKKPHEFDHLFGNILISERKSDDSNKKKLDLKVSKYNEEDLFDFKTDFFKRPKKSEIGTSARRLPPMLTPIKPTKPKNEKSVQFLYDTPFAGDQRIDTEGPLLTDILPPLKNTPKPRPNQVGPKSSMKPTISGMVL
jgi:hypothetical protein